MSHRSQDKQHRRAKIEKKKRALREARYLADDFCYQAQSALRFGDVQESIFLAEKAVRTYYDHYPAHGLLADIYFNRVKDYGRALPHLEFLARSPDSDPSARYFLGYCYFRLNSYKRALEAFGAFLENLRGKKIQGKLEDLKRLAEHWIQKCERNLAKETLAPKPVMEKEKIQSAASPQKSGPPAIQEAAKKTGPEIELEPRSINIKFSFPGLGDGGRSLNDRILLEQYESYEDYALRLQYHQLTLIKEFDELLCLPTLKNVDHYWYQIETVKNVLKNFRGRVLLADEVGLGKTIEAGMLIKEYITRDLVKRVLILVPASLISQWYEEMVGKFGLTFTTTDAPLYKQNPEKFWKETDLILASLQLARHTRNLEVLASQDFDLVVVDEAHYLKNRRSQNWKLVNSLKKKFIFLISATPVHNNLVELYNLITLLKPGLLKTEAQFKKEYVKRGNPRMPVNSEKLRELLREVMIRNTRSLVDVKLPKRFAATIVVPPSALEWEIYTRTTSFVRSRYEQASTMERFTLNTLQEEAGSSPYALQGSLEKLLGSRDWDLQSREELEKIFELTRSISVIEKVRKLLEMIGQSRAKAIVFTKYLRTLGYLSEVLSRHGVSHSVYSGHMSLTEKDAAIADFRDKVNLLLSTESGGEGRNLQFANTVINFDLPWNPMRIEQRIGRIHRIGQTQDVFVFNFCLQDSIEDYMLRVLDKKINMFELVVGEIDTILGNLEAESDFGEIIMQLWVGSQTPQELEEKFDELGEQLLAAKAKYEEAKALDDILLGEDYEV